MRSNRSGMQLHFECAAVLLGELVDFEIVDRLADRAIHQSVLVAKDI